MLACHSKSAQIIKDGLEGGKWKDCAGMSERFFVGQ